MRSDPVLANLWIEITAYLGTLVVCLIASSTGGLRIVNVIAPIALAIVAGGANAMMVKRDPNLLLSPLFGLRLIALVMLGLGGLFHLLAPEAVREQMDYLYAAGVEEEAKVYLVWLSGMLLTMIGVAAAIRMFGRAEDYAPAPSSIATPNWRPPAMAFAAGFVVDATLNLMQSFQLALPIPSSFILVFSAVQLVGLFFLGEMLDRSKGARIVACLALILSILFGLILMNKTVVLLPSLILSLGYLRARISFRRVLTSVVVVASIYFTINPIVVYSRSRHYQAHSVMGTGTFEDRISYLRDYWNGDRAFEGTGEATSYSMARLDYVMPASFVIAQYDRGVPSDEIATSGYMLIPRFLWPDKPVTTTAGLAVNYLLGIQSTNQIAVTMLADLYWNFGWPGLSLMLIAGFFIGIGTLASRRILKSGDWLMMPFVFVAFRASLGFDGNFATGLMIPIIMAIALYWALRALRVVLPKSLGGAS